MYIELFGSKPIHEILVLIGQKNLFTIVFDHVEKLKSIPGPYRNTEPEGVGKG